MGETNIVPVDYVAAAMDHIAHEPGLDGRAFHLVSPEPQRTLDVINAFSKVAGAPRVTGALPREALELALKVPGVRGSLLPGIGIPETVIDYADFTARFDATQAQQALAGSGIAVPPLEDYAPVLWRYWCDNLADGG
jgi:hypothetical protein